MFENVMHVTRKDVQLEGRKAFEHGKLRGSNPYIKINQEFALIWWYGWDAVQLEKIQKANKPGEITLSQRERAYGEGKLAFEEGTRRISNPYTASNTTLEQVWMNGWDHSRRITKKGRPLQD
jgi:hypothetical protein